jgi:hypothetical protein
MKDFKEAAEKWFMELIQFDEEDNYTKQDCYQAGYHAGYSEAMKEQRWIPVSEGLPHERFLPVLVFNGDAPEYNQCVTQATWFLESKSFKRETQGKYLGTITHWKPLPSPPSFTEQSR